MGELESPTPGEPQFTTQGSSSSPGELQFPTHFLCTDKKIALILGALYLSHQNRSVFLRNLIYFLDPVYMLAHFSQSFKSNLIHFIDILISSTFHTGPVARKPARFLDLRVRTWMMSWPV